MDRDQIPGKARALIDYEDRATLFDSLILCRFFRDFVLWDELQELVAAITGIDTDKDKLAAIAAETTRLARQFNRREGLNAQSDTLPEAFFKATEEGEVISREELTLMLKEYNELRG